MSPLPPFPPSELSHTVDNLALLPYVLPSRWRTKRRSKRKRTLPSSSSGQYEVSATPSDGYLSSVSVRSLVFLLLKNVDFFLPACAELGLVSQQIHKFGRDPSHYASLMWKNDLGLLLAAVIVSLLVTIFHYQLGLGGVYLFFCAFSCFLSVFVSACYFLLLAQALTSHSAGIIFFSLVLAVFFATGAGIIRGVTPFRGTSCGKAANLYPVIWQPFVGECRRIVSIQAIAWTLCTFFWGELCDPQC